MALSAAQKRRLIVALAFRFGVDPRAALAVAMREGGFGGAIGDAGTSFGPYQLHAGGALPSGIGNPQAWANRRKGLSYALRHIAGVSKGLRGREAIQAIVSQFERPAAPGPEIADAWRYYQQIHLPGKGLPRMGGNNVQPRPPSGAASLAPLLAALGGGGQRVSPQRSLAALQAQSGTSGLGLAPNPVTVQGVTSGDLYAQIEEMRKRLLAA